MKILKTYIVIGIVPFALFTLCDCGNKHVKPEVAEIDEIDTLRLLNDDNLEVEIAEEIIIENDGTRLLKEGYTLDTIPEWNGYIRIRSNNKGEGLLSPDGKIIYSPKIYSGVLGFGHHTLLLHKIGSKGNTLEGLGDFDGNVLVPVLYEDLRFRQNLKEGYVVVKWQNSEGVYSFSDKKEILPCKYDFIFCTYDGYIATREHHYSSLRSKVDFIYRLYDYGGNEVADPIISDKDNWPVPWSDKI